MRTINILILAITAIIITLMITDTLYKINYDSQTVKGVGHDCRFFDEWQNNLACRKIDDRERIK